MEYYFSKTVELVGEYWWVVFWLIFCASYIFSTLKSLFSPTKKKRLKKKLEAVNAEYDDLLEKYNKLVVLINLKGGMSFIGKRSSQFSSDEIKNLVKLCHPDKHGGSVLANDMTAKLLELG